MLEGIAAQRDHRRRLLRPATGSARCWPPTARAAAPTSIAFAKAWDRFAFRDSRRRRARRATERELLILKSHLEASLLATPAEHPAPVRRYDDYPRLMALVEAELGAASEVGCRPALRP